MTSYWTVSETGAEERLIFKYIQFLSKRNQLCSGSDAKIFDFSGNNLMSEGGRVGGGGVVSITVAKKVGNVLLAGPSEKLR